MTTAKKSRIGRVVFLASAICLFSFPAQAKYSGGRGVPDDPYQIATAADLIVLGETPDDYDKHFVLTADIDLDPNLPGRKVFDKAVIAPASRTNVYPYVQGTPFTGVFDGNGHTISHLTVKGYTDLGLFGYLESGAVLKNLGVVDVNIAASAYYVGGLVGKKNGTVSCCYVTGEVSGNYSVGGLVGFDESGTVTQCHSTGAVSGRGYVGGLVGSTSGCRITTSYSNATVSGNEDVGGLVGRNSGDVTYSYSTGSVNGTSDVGGLVGENWGGSVSSSFWDIQTSGQMTSAGGTGLSTVEMQNIQTYQHAGWDFAGEIEDGLHEIWQMPEGGGYPVLAILSGYIPHQLEGYGTPDSPYLVSNAVDLGALIHYSPSAYCRLAAPIDLSGIRWGTAVIPQFAGTFDGNNLTISHLTIVGGSYLGLFGQLGRSDAAGEVRDLGVVDVTITGSGDYIGGLVGRNGGNVTHCYSTGSVSGTGTVGGLVGNNYGGTVSECYSTGVVNGTSGVGGLVGRNYSMGSVTHCYSTGSVNGTSDVGGLVGENWGGSVSSSFWDIQTSGQTTSAGGSGKATAEMQTLRTFLLWGTCGNEGIWTIDEGNDYPRLAWENRPGEAIGLSPLSDLLLGTGTESDPFLIYTSEELYLMGLFPCEWDKHFKLMEDVDLSGFDGKDGRPAFNIIGASHDNAFTGLFDGNNHTILHLTIIGDSHLGLFGYLGPGAKVTNIRLVDVDIVGTGDTIGGLVGENHGSVTQCSCTGVVCGNSGVGGLVGSSLRGIVALCYSTGTVRGVGVVGGLVGSNADYWGDKAILIQCLSSSRVSGNWGVGGLVGGNSSTVIQCYSTGPVDGTHTVGGLVGGNDGGRIAACYSTSAVSGNWGVGGLVGSNGLWGHEGVANQSFWDIQTSGQTWSFGGTGKTTGEMQTATTFLEAGWDFVGEAANGTEDIWWILEGKDYPRLLWEFLAFSPDPPNRATDVILSPTLCWLAARKALAHDIYFGEDLDLVVDGTPESWGIYRGRQALEMTSYDPATLEWGKTYYWRVDEVNEANPDSPWKGSIWSFTTVDNIIIVTVVDDFESYTDDMKVGQAIFQTWLDGSGYASDPNDPTDPPAYAGNGTGSIVGNSLPPYAEQEIVHIGRQSMPMDYNDVNQPWYSEAQRTWNTPQDWTIGEAETLTLYFRGKAGNGRDPLYVGIEDSAGRIAVVAHPDADAVLATEWQKWHIALADLQVAGVDVAAVKKVFIGVGDRDNPQPGGTGRIYIDDIRLTKRMP